MHTNIKETRQNDISVYLKDYVLCSLPSIFVCKQMCISVSTRGKVTCDVLHWQFLRCIGKKNTIVKVSKLEQARKPSIRKESTQIRFAAQNEFTFSCIWWKEEKKKDIVYYPCIVFKLKEAKNINVTWHKQWTCLK